MTVDIPENRGLNGRVEEPAITPSSVTEDQAQQEGSSDGEGERATRERLKQTSIAGMVQASSHTASATEAHSLTQPINMETEPPAEGNNIGRGRPAKKRSFEDLTRSDSNMDASTEMSEQPLPKSGHHKRMRSRDVASGEHVISKFDADGVASVREESDVEAQKSPGGAGVLIDSPLNMAPAKQEPEKTAETQSTSEDHPESEPKTSIPQSQAGPASAFANTSSTSPFSSFSPAKPQSSLTTDFSEPTKTTTSPSAFASSGLSAFASTEKSPFGAAGSQSGSAFGGLSPPNTFGSSSSIGGFGNSNATSTFASKPLSGFGSGGGFGSTSTFGSTAGFGVPKPFGSSFSGFAGASSGVNTFGTGKPIGTVKTNDDETSEHDGEEDDEQSQDRDASQDERFHEQDVETGEENENTVFSCRAKLYHFEQEWKERGVGMFKINVRHVETSLKDYSDTQSGSKALEDDPQLSTESSDKGKGDDKGKDFSGDDLEAGAKDTFITTERKARLLMRSDGVHRVILNTPVFKEMQIGQHDGSEPVGKTMHLTGLEDGKPKAFQIKIGKEEVLRDLYRKVIELRADL